MFFFKKSTLTSSAALRISATCVFLASTCIASLAWSADQASVKSKISSAQTPPKLVLLLVVDGLPQEQIQRYRNQFGEGGFKRLLDQGAWFSNAHQAHGITKTAIGHSAISTGAYPYQHGIVGNDWINNQTFEYVYCTEDKAHTYIGEETKPNDGTSPANLKSTTIGDELRYASGYQSKVIGISGKDRGAILLAGKTGTAYMLMKKSGAFASSTYYMQEHPQWVNQFHSNKPQDRYYGKTWAPLLSDSAYKNDAKDDLVAPSKDGISNRFPFTFDSKSGKPDAEYYGKLFTGPFVDELTLDFAKAAIDGEKLGNNPSGATDVLAVSLSGHDYVNHEWGPESRMSHDHLQRIDRMLAQFFKQVDQRVGMDNTLVIFTSDHGFSNTIAYSQSNKIDAQRVDNKVIMQSLNQLLNTTFGLTDGAKKMSSPIIHLDYAQIDAKGLAHDKVEQAAAQFLLKQNGIAHVYTRTQLESGALPQSRMSLLAQRAWNSQVSGDIMIVLKPYWNFGSRTSGAQHESPYRYDTNVPLMIMGKPWIKAGAYGEYAEVVDIASTLAHLLHVRPPPSSEGRVLTETLK